MTAITHQQIADRLGELHGSMSAAIAKARAAIDAERESLCELCGGIGHIWQGQSGGNVAITSEPESGFTGRWCCVCGTQQRKAA